MQSQKEKCNQRLLQNFGLDGLWNKENAKDSMICSDINAANNCCSEIDEIKIVKLWNDYSLPKIDKFRDESILAAKKILNIAPFIKTLNIRDINYHGVSLIWKKKQEKKCFNGKYFVSETNLKEMLKDQQLGDDWYTLWTKRALSEIINNIILKVEKLNFMPKRHLFRYIVDPFYKDKNIYNAMMNVRDNYFLYNNKKKIIKGIMKIFKNTNQGFFNQQALQNTDIKSYVRNTIGIRKIVYQVVDYDLPNKEIRVIKDYTMKQQMNKLINKLKQNQKSIIAFKEIDSSTRQHFINELVKFLWDDRELKHMLSFVYWPHTFETTNENYKVFAEINARFVRGVSYVAERVPLGGLNKYTFLQHVIKNMQQHLHIIEILKHDLYRIILPFIIPKIMPRFRYYVYYKLYKHHYREQYWKEKLIKLIPFKKVRRHFYKKLSAKQWDRRRKYDQMMRNMNSLSGRLNLNLPYYKRLHDLRAPIIQAMKQTYKNGIAPIPRSFRPHGALKFLGRLYSRVASQIDAMLVRDAYVEIKDDKKVCAVIIKHDLFRKMHFNKKKYEHCQKMHKEFSKLNSDELLLPIQEMKIQLQKLNNMKKGFYCDICNKQSQKYIDIEKKLFTYSQDFCFDLLTEFKSYIEWKNSRFIEFLSTTFQYIQCYATDGSDDQFPYDFIGQDHMKDVKMVKECGKIKNKDDVKKCQKLCENFDYVHYSNFFDGEKKFLEKMYTLILNVVRKHGFKFQVLETIQSGKEPHYNSNITIEDLEKDLNTEKKMIETFGSGEQKNEYIKRSMISTVKKTESKKDDKKESTDKKKSTGKGRLLSLFERKRKHKHRRKLKVTEEDNDYIDAFSRAKQLVRVKKWDTLRGEWIYEYVPYKKAERMRKLKEEKKQEEKKKEEKKDEKKIEEMKAKVLASDELQKIIKEAELQIKKKHKSSTIIENFKKFDKDIYHDIPKNFVKKITDTKNIDESTLKTLISEIQKVKVEVLEKERKEKEKKEWEKKYKDMFLPPQPRLQLIKTIANGGDKLLKFTKPKYFKYDEINLQESTYQVKQPNIDFRSFKVVIKDKGLNPAKLSYKTNFTTDVLERIWRTGEVKNYEILNKEVLRDYLVINKEELQRFNGDYKLDMKVQKKEVIKTLRPKPKKPKKKPAAKDNKTPATANTTQKNQQTPANSQQTQTTANAQQQKPNTQPAQTPPAQTTQGQTQPTQQAQGQTQTAQQTNAQQTQKRQLQQNKVSKQDFYNLIVKLLF